MSTLVGHSLVATLATRATGIRADSSQRTRIAIVAVLLAILPDLDIAFFLAVRPLGMTPHRGASHTLLFALLTATLATLLSSRWLRLSRARLWLGFFLAAASHPALDWLMGAGPPVPFFAPLVARGFLCPWRLLPVAYYGKVGGAYLQPGFWLLNGLAAAVEAVIFAPLLLLADAGLRRRRLAVALALGGLLLSFRIYG